MATRGARFAPIGTSVSVDIRRTINSLPKIYLGPDLDADPQPDRFIVNPIPQMPGLNT